MICEKCGLEIKQQEITCPRCGDVLPKEIMFRDSIERGSLDEWAETPTGFQAIEEEKEGLEAYLEQHPSATFFFGALAFRLTFYLLAALSSLITDINIWHGWGLVANCIIAAMATVLILLKLEDRDFFWGKTIPSILVLTDTLITFIIVVWPVFKWIVEVVVNTFV